MCFDVWITVVCDAQGGSLKQLVKKRKWSGGGKRGIFVVRDKSTTVPQ